jgi:hypothetical protein
MLTQDGELTDIGSWYMGGVATNNVPKGSAAPGNLLEGRYAFYLVTAFMLVYFV